MITIKAKYGRVAVTGHADYAPKGQDIVCSGVSVLLYTLAAALGDDIVDIRLDTGDSEITWKTTKKTNATQAVINHGFRLLANSYPHYVQFSFEGN